MQNKPIKDGTLKQRKAKISVPKRTIKDDKQRKASGKPAEPPRFLELVREMSLVSGELPTWNFTQSEKLEDLQSFLKRLPSALVEHLAERIKPHKLPDAAQKEISYDDGRAIDLMIKEFAAYRLYKNALREFAELCEYFRENFSNDYWSEFDKFSLADADGYDGSTVHLDALRPELTFSKRHSGYSSNRFIEAISKVTNTDYVRICKACGNVFWAYRSDSKTCSTHCFNGYKQKEARKRNKGKNNESL